MNRKKGLLLQAGMKYILGLIMVGLLVFLPAGTLCYPGGWLFCGLLFVPMLLLGIVLYLKAPDLLEKRLESREKESAQKQVIGLSLLMFVAGFVLAGLDFRFSWLPMPMWVQIGAGVMLLGAYGMYAEVMRENAYLSRTVRVQDGQQVVDTGLYGMVRHPMYLATTLLFLAIPLVLGSWVAFVVFLLYPVLLIKRIRNEETVLAAELAGYTEYMKKVKWRMLPLIW